MGRLRIGAGIALAALLTAGGCATVEGTPSDRAGFVRHHAGALSFDLPERWRVRGDDRRIRAEAGDGGTRVEAERMERAFRGETDCLANAEEALARGAAALERARRHPTRLGGRSALLQEADSAGWHGWAWAVCDGPTQYRLFFVGRSPLGPEAVQAQRVLEGSARLAPAP
jgi:hypothetical protein